MLNLEPYILRSISDAQTLTTTALRSGMTLEELDRFLKSYMVGKNLHISTRGGKEKERKKIENRLNKFFTRCPICKQKAEILPVNSTPSTVIGGNFKSAWLCHNPSCMHTEYSELSPAQIYYNRLGESNATENI